MLLWIGYFNQSIIKISRTLAKYFCLEYIVNNSMFYDSVPMCPVNLALFYEPLTITYIKDKISNRYTILLQMDFKIKFRSCLQSSLTPKPNNGLPLFTLCRKGDLFNIAGQLQQGSHVGETNPSMWINPLDPYGKIYLRKINVIFKFIHPFTNK